MIKRLLPWPLLTLSLIVMWLVLNRSLGLGQIILAVIFGIGAPALLAPLRPARPRVRHPLTVIRLILAVGHDVVESTIAVFLGVLPLWIFIRLASRGRPRRSVGEDGNLTVPAHPALGEAGRGPDGEHAKPDQ